MKLLVTGTRGQVVTSLLERGTRQGHEIVALGRPELDLASPDRIAAALRAHTADVIVSAAAYTAVDRAETDRDEAFSVNAKAPAAIAEAASGMGIPLIHLSTDYVFDGSKPEPYVESDPPAPLGAYGVTKLAGEEAISRVYASNSVILRTAWIYSPFGANFVRTMLRLAADRDSLAVVADQFGNPTSALDIADGVIAVAERLSTNPAAELRGVFHMTAGGETHWAGFARQIFALSRQHGGPSAEVTEITTAEYPTAARRPANSRLSCEKLHSAYGISLPNWRDSLADVVSRLLA